MIHFFTIVLDGMPWITHHLPIFNRLEVDWRWWVMEGTAKSVGCTDWCKPLKPRLSLDGTTEYLDQLSYHPAVTVKRKKQWDGKLQMVNSFCDSVEPGDLVMEVDADELWSSDQIRTILQLMKAQPEKNGMLFRCRYFVGLDKVITSQDTYGNRSTIEWRRVWRAGRDFKFTRHEPPEIADPVSWIPHKVTESLGLVFDHYAYATERQVAFKEGYYGYAGAVEAWRRLQSNEKWPAKLSQFLPWVKDGAIVEPL